MISILNWERKSKANIERGGWRKDILSASNILKMYTQGSKMEDGVGAGYT